LKRRTGLLNSPELSLIGDVWSIMAAVAYASPESHRNDGTRTSSLLKSWRFLTIMQNLIGLMPDRL